MRVLVVGNLFQAFTIVVNNFPKIDGESAALEFRKKEAGAALVVSTICRLFNIEPKIVSQNISEGSFDELLNVKDATPNKLLTIYNSDMDRFAYAYIPEPLSIKELDIDFSNYDVVFLCCIDSDTLSLLYKNNDTLSKTVSVLLPNGLVQNYFDGCNLKFACNYMFINRGELRLIQNKLMDHDIYTKVMSLVLGESNLIITAGRHGVYTYINGEFLHHEVKPVAHIMHPGGAGDSFATGFILHYLSTGNTDAAVQIGHEYASRVMSVSDICELWTN